MKLVDERMEEDGVWSMKERVTVAGLDFDFGKDGVWSCGPQSKMAKYLSNGSLLVTPLQQPAMVKKEGISK